jgi:hypothetical protein
MELIDYNSPIVDQFKLPRSGLLEQSIAPKSRVGRFLMVSLLAATSVNRGVTVLWVMSLTTQNSDLA